MMNKKPTFFIAISPIIFLVIFLFINVSIYGDLCLNGPNQIALLVSSFFCSILGKIYSISWDNILIKIKENIQKTSSAIIIILLIGSLTGTWLISGVIPAFVYYGIQIINPKYFFVTACIVSSIVSVTSGSSWSTIATIGIALLGIGNIFGISESILAGAIISGAYFGDKMSPLSDTTNLASAISDSKLFEHINYMTLTTIPSIFISLIIFFILGLNQNNNEISNISDLLLSIEGLFYISPILFIIPVTLFFLIYKQFSPIISLFSTIILSSIFAIIFQPNIIQSIGNNDNYFISSFISVINSMSGEISLESDNSLVNNLLKSKGMSGMLNTVWLILAAIIFGASMEGSGFLNVITNFLSKFAKSKSSLILTTSGTCVLFNLTVSDQYLSILVPGKMFNSAFKKNNLANVNLSRTLEDSATVTSVLIPWNTCGATQSAILGVSTFLYFPFCFFNIISPFMTIIFAYLNIKIKKLKNE